MFGAILQENNDLHDIDCVASVENAEDCCCRGRCRRVVVLDTLVDASPNLASTRREEMEK